MSEGERERGEREPELSKSGDAVRLGDGTTWPTALPLNRDDDANSLEWTLRYGNPTRIDLLHAASVVSAYVALVHEKPQRRRNEIVSKIREACRG